MEQNIIQTDVVKAAAAIKSAIQLTRKTMMLSANKKCSSFVLRHRTVHLPKSEKIQLG